jgi:hypothetical protein
VKHGMAGIEPAALERNGALPIEAVVSALLDFGR